MNHFVGAPIDSELVNCWGNYRDVLAEKEESNEQ